MISSEFGVVLGVALVEEVDGDLDRLLGLDVQGRGLDLRVPEEHLGLDLPELGAQAGLSRVLHLVGVHHLRELDRRPRPRGQLHPEGAALLHALVRHELEWKLRGCVTTQKIRR